VDRWHGLTGRGLAAIEGDAEYVVRAGSTIEGDRGVVCPCLERSCADQGQGGSETAGS
jgi:hypothetical protein